MADVPRDAGNCFGASLVNTCLPALPAAPRTLATAFDTDSADCFVDKGWCVIGATELSVSALRVTGSRPLVLVATGSITVDNMLDVASRRTGNTVELGAAASSPTCIPGQPAAHGGGGAGGTFGGRGGNGGVGTLNSAESGLVVSLTAFRGGCTGGDGAANSGGPSGGAVYLIARTRITVVGTINASGAGGGPGGGGGSGGMIGLEAPTVSVTGSVFANGGGGGEGNGTQGANPTSATSPAPGGSGGTGGDGGAGSAGTTKTGARGGDSATGGGGGGGGAGFIVVIPSQPTGGTMSPAPI